jgi:rhamnulokinase
VVLESLAFRYRYSADTLSTLSGQKFSRLRLLNGGSKNRLLCQFTPNALGTKVLAGPAEASIMGNFAQQGLAMGTLESYSQALELIGKSEEIVTYMPQDVSLWDGYYRKAVALFGWKQIEAIGE